MKLMFNGEEYIPPVFSPTVISIQEYTTDDGWYVRKWSDGYVEMQYKNTYSISNWNTANNVSGVYTLVSLPSEFPVELVETYQEQVTSIKISGYAAVLRQGCYNKQNSTLCIFQNGSDTSEWMVYLNVTGRWK